MAGIKPQMQVKMLFGLSASGESLQPSTESAAAQPWDRARGKCLH